MVQSLELPYNVKLKTQIVTISLEQLTTERQVY